MENKTANPYKEIPKDYGRKVFAKTVYARNSKGSENNAPTLLKNRQTYGLEERSSASDSRVYLDSRRLKGIVRDPQNGNSIIEKIILNDRQIVLKLEPGRLSAYAELNDGTKVGYHGKEIIRKFMPGLSLRVLSNTRNAIVSGLQSLEKNCRKEYLHNQLHHYFTTYPGMLYIVPQVNEISLNSETIENAMEKLSEKEEGESALSKEAESDFIITLGDMQKTIGQLSKKEEPVRAALSLLKQENMKNVDKDIQNAYLKQELSNAA